MLLYDENGSYGPQAGRPIRPLVLRGWHTELKQTWRTGALVSAIKPLEEHPERHHRSNVSIGQLVLRSR
jgi:hypothetical protein